MRKLIKGAVLSILLGIVPCLGNLQALSYAHIWFLMLIGAIANVFQPDYRAIDRSAPTQDRGTAAQILWTICVIQLLAVIEAVYLRYPASFSWDIFSYLALPIMLLGLLIRTWAVFTLGELFTWHVTQSSAITIVRSGPYRWVRHPSYTGALLTYILAPVFLHAWYTALLGLVLIPLAFARRIRLEEGYLLESLGEEYRKYSQEVRAVVPMIW